jgi:glycosyltransferase involved in cell wall biosynthesis
LKIIFWLSLIGVGYTYAGYPLVMWALARWRPRRWRTAPILPSVSFLLAVRDGAALIRQKVEHLLGTDYPNLREVIVVSDGSTDGTAELLKSYSDPRLRPIVLEEHGGKAVAVNAGLAEASGDIIVFVDIRPEIAAGAIQQLMSNFADPSVGCVSGNLKLRLDGHDAASSAVGGFYWRYEQWIRTCEALVDSPVGVYGGFYAIRRELAARQPAGIILDDMFEPLAIIHQGYRSVVDAKAFVYDTWPKKVEGEFQRKVRTLAGNFQLFRLAPWTLTLENRVLFQLVSHKVMRLVVPYLLLALLASSVVLASVSIFYTAAAVCQVLGWGLAVAGLWYRVPVLHRVAAPASALLVLNAAAVVGLYKFLFTRGPLINLWKTNRPMETEPGA